MKGQYDKLGTNYAKELEQKVTAGMAAAKAELRAATEAQDVDRQVEAQKAIAQMAMEETRLGQLKNYQEQKLEKAQTPTRRHRYRLLVRDRDRYNYASTDLCICSAMLSCC